MQLDPCPFCGGEAERLELTDEDNFGGSVICCKQCGASSSVHFDRKENLEDGWNRRVQAVQPVPVVTYEPEFQTAPDNGTVDEVLAYVLDCARRWEPKARIIGNARAGDIVRAITATASAEPVAWQPIETAPKEQEVLIAYWRWRNSMSPGSVIVQSARQVEYHGDNIWSWVVEDNKHGPFPIRGWCDGDMIGWQSLPAAPLPAQGGKADE